MIIDNKKRGIFLILFSALCFTLMYVFSRLSGDIPVMEKTFFRNLIAVLVIAAIFWRRQTAVLIRVGCLKFHVLRSLAGTLAVISNFYAVDHMMLSDAVILIELSPFLVILFSALLLREKTSIYQWILITIAFIGASFVIKPSSVIFTDPTALIALASAVLTGFAYTMVRILGVRGEDGSVVIMFFSAFSCIACLPFVVFDHVPMSLQQLSFLLIAALCACCGQFAVTAAYRYAPASEISVFDYSQIIFSALLGWLVFDQVSDMWSYLGYAVIMFSAFVMYFLNIRNARS